MLRQQGIGATTFDAIARQAGVARSTLYRNWSSRDDLLIEAIEEQAPFPGAVPGEPVSAQLEAALGEIKRRRHTPVTQHSLAYDHVDRPA